MVLQMSDFGQHPQSAEEAGKCYLKFNEKMIIPFTDEGFTMTLADFVTTEVISTVIKITYRAGGDPNKLKM